MILGASSAYDLPWRMLIKPNQTDIVADVVALEREPDGHGATVRLLVHSNESAEPGADFLRPAAGSTIEAFCADPSQVRVGQRVSARLRRNADAFGGRNVVQAIRVLKPSGAG
jgi:hypothetical protein